MNKTQYEKVIQLIYRYGRECHSSTPKDIYAKNTLKEIKLELKKEKEKEG